MHYNQTSHADLCLFHRQIQSSIVTSPSYCNPKLNLRLTLTEVIILLNWIKESIDFSLPTNAIDNEELYLGSELALPLEMREHLSQKSNISQGGYAVSAYDETPLLDEHELALR